MKYSLIIIALVSLCYAQPPAEIVPALANLVATFRASGTLNINCTSDTTVSGPLNINSILTNPSDGTQVGTYTGPFNHNDGSSTRVTVPTINPTASLNPGNLANFLGVAQRTEGSRIFDKIVFITRYNTSGGFVDPSTCSGNTGRVTNVPFQATYGFYQSASPAATAGTLKNTFRAFGTLQITCSNGAYSGPSGINSVLLSTDGSNTQVGIYNGSFVSNDGSATRTSGTPAATNNAYGRALASFLASAVTVPGTRVFDNIGQITRYDTVGGVANSTTPACNAQNEGNPVTVPFEATYGFYTARANSVGSLVASAIVVVGLVVLAL